MSGQFNKLAEMIAIGCVLTFLLTLNAISQGADSVREWEDFDFRSKEITADQLKDLTLQHLKYMRGIVFGKHGRVFDEKEIQDWLKTRKWYRSDPKFVVTVLNDTEQKDMDAIKEAEYHKHAHIEPGDLKFFRNSAVTKEQLGKHSQIEWMIMKSEIEAIHGKQFPETPWLQSFFEERYWFKAVENYDPKSLNESERQNQVTIAQAAKDQRGVMLAPGDMIHFQETPISRELLKGLSLFELRLLRNEVYARNGMKFRTRWLQEHFSMEPWYSPLPDFEEPKLTAVESKNVTMIITEERRIHDSLATSSLSKSLLEGLMLEDARKLRNEIYAKHGKIFRDKWLDSYFHSLNWYKPDAKFKETELNAIETRNVSTLLAYEKAAEKEVKATAA